MGNVVKYLPLEEFVSEGYLHEVNRLFFHPLGLALEVRIDEEPGESGQEPKKAFSLHGVWDFRDDPEGMLFATAPDPEKIASVEKQRLRVAEGRLACHGFTIQPEGYAPVRATEPVVGGKK